MTVSATAGLASIIGIAWGMQMQRNRTNFLNALPWLDTIRYPRTGLPEARRSPLTYEENCAARGYTFVFLSA